MKCVKEFKFLFTNSKKFKLFNILGELKFLIASVGDKVGLKSYEATASGLIQSWVERFPAGADLDQKLTNLWQKEKPYFTD